MAQTAARIVKTPDVLGGKPRIAGRRLGVYYVREQVEGRGLDPETFAAKHDLDVAEVYHALAYFHDHPEEMAAIERDRKRVLEDADDDPRVVTGPEDLENASRE